MSDLTPDDNPPAPNAESGSVYELLGDAVTAKLIDNIRNLDSLADKTGGWSGKADCRQTGLSYHAKFVNKVDVDTTYRFLVVLENAPAMLNSTAQRLLEADAEVRRLRAHIDGSGSGL